MRLNENIVIQGRKILLVPYRQEHVLKYHQWMKSEELQKLTASEPLTLQEEYEMQKSWREDEDKCTFIVLDKAIYDVNKDEIASMVGDTNIFITDKEEAIGEIEIMIAEKSARGKQFGKEAIALMLLYGIKYVKLKCFEAKISFSNEISLKMFQNFEFQEKSRSEVFEEITLEKRVSDDWVLWLNNQASYEICTCS